MKNVSKSNKSKRSKYNKNIFFQIEISLIPIFKIILYITIIITETTRFNKVTTKVNTLYLFDAATKLDPTLKKIRKSRNKKINIQLKAPL